MEWLMYAIAAFAIIAVGWYYFVTMVNKIYGRKSVEANKEKQWFGTLYNNHIDAVISVDQNFRIMEANSRVEELLGIQIDYFKGRPIETIVTAVKYEQQEMLRDYFMRVYCGELTEFNTVAHNEDGSSVALQLQCIPFQIDDVASGSHFIIRDITKEVQSLEQMKELAYQDELTGLANRRHFYELLQQFIVKYRVTGVPIAVLIMDLDGFKQINDSIGHFAGDRYLQSISDQLRKVAAAYQAEIARLGGDEFAIVFEHDQVWTAAEKLSEQIIAHIQEAIPEQEQIIPVSISIGIAIYPDDKLDMMDLLKAADEALYGVKSNGKNGYRFYKEKENYVKKKLSAASEINDNKKIQTNERLASRHDDVLTLTNSDREHI
ncbi:diguanylate cyclase domain-containing protein [Paenibacillus yanchengensis]|uniref:Diguanylate cyclase domain-containing protein n=1 Tax=Paenibacillus yanchengensis TaxID=2035833 RepID=A0ABW4YQ78_9BACL